MLAMFVAVSGYVAGVVVAVGAYAVMLV